MKEINIGYDTRLAINKGNISRNHMESIFSPLLSSSPCVPYIPAEPYGGEVAPAQLSDDVVPAVEHISDPDRVVATCGRRQYEWRVSCALCKLDTVTSN